MRTSRSKNRHPHLHRNTGRFTQDPVCEQLLSRIAQDENLHMVFYRNVLASALELAPDETMQAIWDVVSTSRCPETPLTASPGAPCRSPWPASTTCGSTATKLLAPILRSWGVWDRAGLSGSGEQAREQLGSYFDELDQQASRFEERRAARQRTAARS